MNFSLQRLQLKREATHDGSEFLTPLTPCGKELRSVQVNQLRAQLLAEAALV